MNIAALRTRIIFQKSETFVDEYRNRKSEWVPYFECSATVSKTGGGETTNEMTTATEIIDFTTRCCSELKEVEPDRFRILCKGKKYNILYVDPMAFKGNSLKFHCETERRHE